MQKISKKEKKFIQEQFRIMFFLQGECDTYEEWLHNDCKSLVNLDEKTPFYHNTKQTLEDIFRRRESVKIEELEKYIENLKPIKQYYYIKLLVFYQDIFKDDSCYDKQLVEDTIKYFNFSEKAFRWIRDWSIAYKEVEDEVNTWLTQQKHHRKST